MRFEKGIHCQCNCMTISQRTRKCHSEPREMTLGDRKEDNIWKIDQLEPQIITSGTWNACPWELLLYLIFLVPFISRCLWIGWSQQHLRLSDISESSNSIYTGQLYLYILGSLASSAPIAEWCNVVVRRWKQTVKWSFPFLLQLFWTLWQVDWFPSQKPCGVSGAYYVNTSWHCRGNILQSWLSTWRRIWRTFIITRMDPFNPAPEHLEQWTQ